jgi:plastocyanin
MSPQRQRSLARLATAAVVLSLIGSAAAACDTAADADPTPVNVFKITPTASAGTLRTPANATATKRAESSPSAGEIDISANDLKFSTNKLTASAGTVTIVFDNQDFGVPHNIHVLKGTTASGDSVGVTAIESGPKKQTLKLELAAGTYYFRCDVHPTMNGSLTVN